MLKRKMKQTIIGKKRGVNQALGVNQVLYCFPMFDSTIIKNRYLDLTDVCPLLTKQYIQVGLQMQYMLCNF
jgi:hypothetical protein